MFISPAGHPLVVSVLDSHPPGVFDTAAVEAALGFRYELSFGDASGRPIAGTIPDGIHAQQRIFYIPSELGSNNALTKWRCALPPPSTLIVSAAAADAPVTIQVSPRGNNDDLLPDTAGASQTVPLRLPARPSDLVTMPVPVGKILHSGWVKVDFCVGSDGRAVQPWVEDSAPHGLYDRAALAALATWKFAPREEHGKKVRTCYVTYTIPVITSSDLERGPVEIQAAATVVNLRYLSNGARHRGYIHGGKVLARFCVDTNGSLSDVGVFEPPSTSTLAAAAVDVLYSFQYWPRQRDGKWVRTCNVEQTLQFRDGNGLLYVHG